MEKVFFACSMRGGRDFINEHRDVVETIKKLGLTLVSEHQVQENILEEEDKLTSRQIYDRDYNWLKEADCLIAEISNPSLGVGAEIADAVEMKKPVLCLYKKDVEKTVSEYIRGKPSIEVYAYNNVSEIEGKISAFVKR